MSNQVTKVKEPLLRMAKRDTITSKQAWILTLLIVFMIC